MLHWLRRRPQLPRRHPSARRRRHTPPRSRRPSPPPTAAARAESRPDRAVAHRGSTPPLRPPRRTPPRCLLHPVDPPDPHPTLPPPPEPTQFLHQYPPP